MHPHHSHVLQLDIQGTPQACISLEHAAMHVATGSVAWVDGVGPQCEPVVPQARGGRWTWMNLVTACGVCNGRKADRTPEQARMPLVYLPYVPSRFEDLSREGRHIRADVPEWLAARLPRGSRLI
jgi:hypothetical protein